MRLLLLPLFSGLCVLCSIAVVVGLTLSTPPENDDGDSTRYTRVVRFVCVWAAQFWYGATFLRTVRRDDMRRRRRCDAGLNIHIYKHGCSLSPFFTHGSHTFQNNKQDSFVCVCAWSRCCRSLQTVRRRDVSRTRRFDWFCG